MPYIIGLLIVVFDQLSKYLYVNVFGAPDVTLIKGLLGLTYVQNRGAAWGMMANRQMLLYIISFVITVVLLIVFIKHYRKMNGLMRYALAVIIAGALGNVIDRLILNYVRDMIQFRFIEFPVFNIADMAITIGGALLIIDVLFFEKTKATEKTEKDGSDGKEE